MRAKTSSFLLHIITINSAIDGDLAFLVDDESFFSDTITYPARLRERDALIEAGKSGLGMENYPCKFLYEMKNGLAPAMGYSSVDEASSMGSRAPVSVKLLRELSSDSNMRLIVENWRRSDGYTRLIRSICEVSDPFSPLPLPSFFLSYLLLISFLSLSP
jgi:hypothetical protein